MNRLVQLILCVAIFVALIATAVLTVSERAQTGYVAGGYTITDTPGSASKMWRHVQPSEIKWGNSSVDFHDPTTGKRVILYGSIRIEEE